MEKSGEETSETTNYKKIEPDALSKLDPDERGAVLNAEAMIAPWADYFTYAPSAPVSIHSMYFVPNECFELAEIAHNIKESVHRTHIFHNFDIVPNYPCRKKLGDILCNFGAIFKNDDGYVHIISFKQHNIVAYDSLLTVTFQRNVKIPSNIKRGRLLIKSRIPFLMPAIMSMNRCTDYLDTVLVLFLSDRTMLVDTLYNSENGLDFMFFVLGYFFQAQKVTDSYYHHVSWRDNINPTASVNKDRLSTLTSLDCKIMESHAIIEYVLKTWPLDKIFLCFDGGKDATVMIHIFYSILLRVLPDRCSSSRDVTIFYISNDPLDGVEIFVYETVLYYGATLIELEKGNDTLLSKCFEFSEAYPEKNVCLIGTRASDSTEASLEHFKLSDKNWPDFLRVQPIMNFSYTEIWDYIRTYNVPYCRLYDRGYSSLGPKSTTKPNENLRIEGTDTYRPAYELMDISSERGYRKVS